MKNRTVIGIICIVLAVAVTFVVSPVVNKISDGKTKVVCVANDIAQGSKIKKEDIKIIEVLKDSVPAGAIKESEKAIGKYAVSTLFSGDILTDNKLTKNVDNSGNVLSSLKGDKVAMSVTISSFAGGLSGKLQNGDIVSICVVKKGEETVIPPELKYVKVITTTTKGGVDESEVTPNEDGSFDLPSTITVLVSVKQATILADLEKNASMHVALVYRGDSKTADNFIKTQDKYLKEAKDV